MTRKTGSKRSMELGRLGRLGVEGVEWRNLQMGYPDGFTMVFHGFIGMIKRDNAGILMDIPSGNL